jgi:predicted RND superfamily exporter protein
MLAFGILGWFDIALDFSTMMIAPVIIGIAVDDTVHFITRYRAEVLRGGDITEALQTTITQTGQAIVYTTLVLGLGFGMLAFSSAAGTANVGILGASAIFAGLLNDLFFLPAMILLFKLKFEKSTTPANVVIESIAKEQI